MIKLTVVLEVCLQQLQSWRRQQQQEPRNQRICSQGIFRKYHLHTRFLNIFERNKTMGNNVLPPVSFCSLIIDWPLQTSLTVELSWPKKEIVEREVDF